MTNILNRLPAQWEAMPYGRHWSFAYELNGEKREDYDFRVEFTIGVSDREEAAVIRLLEAAPELLGLLQDISLAMHEGGMRKPKGWLERIDRTIANAKVA